MRAPPRRTEPIEASAGRPAFLPEAVVSVRGYEEVITAPVVTMMDQPEVIRDPIAAMSAARAVELATDASVSSVSDWTGAPARTVLGTEAESETAIATIDGTDVKVERARVRAGDDAVTAVAIAPDDGGTDPAFGEITRDG